jgi:hypothetical protein
MSASNLRDPRKYAPLFENGGWGGFFQRGSCFNRIIDVFIHQGSFNTTWNGQGDSKSLLRLPHEAPPGYKQLSRAKLRFRIRGQSPATHIRRHYTLPGGPRIHYRSHLPVKLCLKLALGHRYGFLVGGNNDSPFLHRAAALIVGR